MIRKQYGNKDKNILDKIKRNNPYFEDFITVSEYHSNAIEGNTLSYAETYSIIFNDNSMTIHKTPRKYMRLSILNML